MTAPDHEWSDYGRWRMCARCGQRQYRAAGQKRGSQAFTTNVVLLWLPEAEPCMPQARADYEPAGKS